MTESLEASGHTGQVWATHIDISALLNTSDQNSPLSSLTVKNKSKGCTTRSGSSEVGGGGSTDPVTQNDINQIILSQLNALGERLTLRKTVTKFLTSDPLKIKSSNKTGKRVKTAVAQKGFERKVAPISGVLNHEFPPPDKLTPLFHHTTKAPD